MAKFKYLESLQRNRSELFDKTYKSSEVVKHSGIYQCDICNCEIVAEKESAFPDSKHHIHTVAQGPIKWRLVVTVNAPMESS